MASNVKTEKDWQAEADAHSLAEAMAMQSDGGRLKAAQGAAKTMIEEEQDRAEKGVLRTRALRKVAKGNYSAEFMKEHGGEKK